MSKFIIPVIQKQIDDNGITTYYEPFVGGGNSIDKIKCEKRIGNDIHKQLIAMWNELQQGWIPPSHISEEEYNNVRVNKENYPDYYVGYVGFHCTFGAKYFGGYARSFKSDGVTPRDESNEAYRNTMKQLPNVMDVEFTCENYLEKDIENAVIYCDPPYQGTTKYEIGAFDYDSFWNWGRNMSQKNIVIISEYNAPADFTCIWEKEVKTLLDSNKDKNDDKNIRVEKLFTYKY